MICVVFVVSIQLFIRECMVYKHTGTSVPDLWTDRALTGAPIKGHLHISNLFDLWVWKESDTAYQTGI